MGKGSNTTTTSSSNTSRADPQADALYRQILERAQGAAETPYQSYNGELVAPVNAQQNLGIGNINSYAGFAQPYIERAAGYANQAAGPISASQIQNYMSPYTQSVVDATQAQFNNQNQQQQQQLTGNAISQGALGGNRVGVAQANLAGQQATAQNPVIAGLYSQGYQQALGAAQQDAQRQQAAAYSLGNLGVAGQNAGLTGAQSQVGAGTLQQQTQQGLDTANYGQFMQEQGYPYQQLSWLAGLGTGVGSQLGGTSSSSGSSTAPASNNMSQWLGLGTAALGFLSDERAKEDIEKVGELNDGQSIYRYRYKGDPRWQIGLIAQQARKHNPDAVHAGVHGLTVDYKRATEGSVERAVGGFVPGFASGGDVAPWSEGKGWIPQIAIHGGSGAPSSAGHAPSAQSSGSTDPNKIAKAAMGIANGIKDFKWNRGPQNILPEVAGFTPAENGTIFSPYQSVPNGGLGGLYHRGGAVAGFAFGGSPDPQDMPDEMGGPPLTFEDRMAPAKEAIANGTWDPQGENYTNLERAPAPAPTVAQEAQDGAPVNNDMAADDGGAASSSALGFAPETGAGGPSGGVPSSQAGFSNPYQPAPSPREDERVGLFLKMSPAAQAGLLAAGFGMMASRSPNLGNAIGEGGIAGMGAYSGVKEAEAKKAMTAQELARDAAKYANDLKFKTDQQAETGRHNKAIEAKEFKPTYGVVKEDPITGIKEYGWINPNDRTTSIDSSRTGSPAASGPIDPNLTGPEYLAELEKHNPGFAKNAKAIGDYRASITTFSLRGGQREKLLDAAQRYNPDYDQTKFTAKNRAVSNFAGGMEGRTLRSLNVAIDHLGTLDEAAKAMQNGDIPALNKVVNYFRRQTGQAVSTNFDSIKQVVSAEIAKAVVGGQTALHDREDMAQRASNSSSPQQLAGIIAEFKKLMAGQMRGLRQQYESSTNLKNFDDFLLPETKRELAAIGNRDDAAEKKVTGKAPPRPSNVPRGSGYSLTQKLWRAPDGSMFRADGSPAGP